MLNTINVNLNTDLKVSRVPELGIKIKSQDINNNLFILRFTDKGKAIELDETYTVEILTKFEKSKSHRLTSATVYRDYARWEFDTSFITQDEKVTNYVYVRKSGSLVVSADANAFAFDVGLSEIDKDAGRVAEVYDENYQKYLDEFKDNVDFEEIAQAEQERKEAEILRQESYDAKVDTAIVEADVVDKVDSKVSELTPQINNLTAQLAKKVGGGKLSSMADMGQDVKEAMTGGSVSVVGKDTVLEENIVNGQVTVNKTDFLKYGKNKFNPKNAKDGFSQTALGEESVDALWSLSEFIPVVSGTTYSLTPKNTSYKRPTFHDVNYNFVELIHAGSNIITPMTYTPTESGYVRIPVLTDGKYSFSFTVTSVSSAFEPFTIEGNDNLLVKPKPDSVGDEELKDNSIGVNKLTFAENSKNLFNKNSPDIEKDKTVGTVAVTPDYDTTEYIPIKSGETYSISHPRRYQTSNSNKTGNEWSDWLNNEPVTFTADRDGFLKVTYLKTNTDYLQIEKGNTSTSYEPYGVIKIPNLHIETPTSENVLRGKRLVGFGDSIGQGGGNVVNGKGRGYIEMIAEQNYMTHKNYSLGGATIAKREGYEHLEINTQIDTAIADDEVADYIVFNGLTNDASATPISRKGEITDSYDEPLDLNTFAGMFEEICRKLINNFTQTKIIYVRVHNMSSRGSQQIEYGELATEICKKYSIPVVDMFNEGGLNTQMIEMTNLYTNNSDSTHPNELGYRTFYVPKIEAKMKSL